MLETFINLLSKAEVIVVDGGPLLSSWYQDEVIGDRENQVLRLSWESEGEVFAVCFTEEGISNATFDNELDEFTLVDHEGESFRLKLCQLTAMRTS